MVVAKTGNASTKEIHDPAKIKHIEITMFTSVSMEYKVFEYGEIMLQTSLASTVADTRMSKKFWVLPLLDNI